MSPDSSKWGFLNLPYELRQTIYSLALNLDSSRLHSLPCSARKSLLSGSTALLRAFRQIYSESHGILHKQPLSIYLSPLNPDPCLNRSHDSCSHPLKTHAKTRKGRWAEEDDESSLSSEPALNVDNVPIAYSSLKAFHTINLTMYIPCTRSLQLLAPSASSPPSETTPECLLQCRPHPLHAQQHIAQLVLALSDSPSLKRLNILVTAPWHHCCPIGRSQLNLQTNGEEESNQDLKHVEDVIFALISPLAISTPAHVHTDINIAFTFRMEPYVPGSITLERFGGVARTVEGRPREARAQEGSLGVGEGLESLGSG